MSEVQQLEKKNTEKPWKGICVKRCWFAKHDKCTCRCKKQNHGKGVLKKLIDMEKEGKSDEKDFTRDNRGALETR